MFVYLNTTRPCIIQVSTGSEILQTPEICRLASLYNKQTQQNNNKCNMINLYE